jgi:hypothetical protein
MNARRLATRSTVMLVAAMLFAAGAFVFGPLGAAAYAAPDAPDAAPAMPVAPPRPPASPKPEAIQVLRAVFGGSSQETQCDATEPVRTACDHRSTCSVPVTLQTCAITTGIAPLIPTLTVVYRCSDVQRQQISSETAPFTLRLACRRKRGV